MNKRLLIAIVLSFTVLIGFSYLFPSPKANQATVKNEMNSSAAPAVNVSNMKKNSNAASTVATPASASVKTAPDVGKKDIIATIQTKRYTLTVDKLGRINSAVLSDDKYRDDNGKKLDLIDRTKTMPLEVRFADTALNEKAFKTPYTASAKELNATASSTTLTLTQNLDSVTFTKRLTFYPDGHYDIDTSVTGGKEYFITVGHRPMADKSRYLIVRGSLVRDNQGVITTIEDGKATEVQKFNDINIVSSFDRYYASLFYNFKQPYTVVIMPDNNHDPVPFVDSKGELKLNGYIGAKEWRLFKKLDPRLTDAIEFGWFTFLAKPFFAIMLSIYNFVGNWGWAIVLFTLLVKLVLFPLSYKGMMSMQKLKDLAPKMKEIKEKYGKDPAKMNQQMMELYKKHGANPMGGCLPMLLQIPVFFALYRVLLNADELQGAQWILWIHDLSKQDPYFVLPVLMGVTMFIQQHITPNNMTDPLQQKIFKWFPVIMTFFFLTFPSGLVLYWLTNNILSIAQQYYINYAYEKYKMKVKAASAAKKKTE